MIVSELLYDLIPSLKATNDPLNVQRFILPMDADMLELVFGFVIIKNNGALLDMGSVRFFSIAIGPVHVKRNDRTVGSVAFLMPDISQCTESGTAPWSTTLIGVRFWVVFVRNRLHCCQL